jgi:hypothetical protein
MGAGNKYFFTVAQKFSDRGSRFCVLAKHHSTGQHSTKVITSLFSATHAKTPFLMFLNLRG